MDDLKQALYLIADEMRGMASMGKYYANNIYQVERAQRMIELAARIAALADEEPLEIVQEIFEREPWYGFHRQLVLRLLSSMNRKRYC